MLLFVLNDFDPNAGEIRATVSAAVDRAKLAAQQLARISPPLPLPVGSPVAQMAADHGNLIL